ncbi:MAG: ABC transporter substrate-binding protein [Casimicrobiaceae bacterium]
MTQRQRYSGSRRSFLLRTVAGTAMAAGGTWAGGFAAGAHAQGSVPAVAAPPLAIGVLRSPTSGIVAIADQKGWFREANLNLSTVLFAAAAGPKIVQALGGGSIGLSFVNATAAVLALSAGGASLKIISIPTDPSRLFALLSKPEIDSVPKLAGKRVAVTGGTALHFYLARTLAKFGMTLKDIEFTNLPAADGQAAFVAGRVDAIVPSVNGRFYLMNAKKDTRELFTYDDFLKGPGPTTPFRSYDLFVTTEEVIKSSRAALTRFLAVYHDKAIPFVTGPATREQAVALITNYVNQEQKNPNDEAVMRRILADSEFYDLAAVRKLVQGDELRASLEEQAKFFVDIGQIKSAPNMRTAIVDNLV